MKVLYFTYTVHVKEFKVDLFGEMTDKYTEKSMSCDSTITACDRLQVMTLNYSPNIMECGASHPISFSKINIDYFIRVDL